MLKQIIAFIVALLLFSSCSSDYDKRLKISTTTWVGYTPLFYAQEKGWLKPLNIKLINVSSLAENMYLYQSGASDAYVGTQYEYETLHADMKTLQPIMMFDRSNGGDLVMGNLSILDLQSTDEEIDVYLELDSINNILLKDFLVRYKLQNKKINYLNTDQTQIKLLKMRTKPTLIVTYIPYNVELQKRGFLELASTKENLDLLVIDAMFTKNELFYAHKKQFIELKKLVDKSIDDLHNDSRAFYEIIKPYLHNISYDEFKNSLHDIIWINKDLPVEFKSRLRDGKFPIRDLI